MMLSVPIIVKETSGIHRYNEPVTIGIPFPRGCLIDATELKLFDQDKCCLPLQSQVLASWPDGSGKWILLDFQVSAMANTFKELKLSTNPSSSSGANYSQTLPSPLMIEKKRGNEVGIRVDRNMDTYAIDTGSATFYVNTDICKPFNRVVIGENDFLNSEGSKIILTDEMGTKYEPKIDDIIIETKGELRTTLKIGGRFIGENRSLFANFVSRLSFFANSSIIKIEFTIQNHRAAEHPGGLWDLGDPGSIFFKDLSIHTALNTNEKPIVTYSLNEEITANNNHGNKELSAKCDEISPKSNLLIYQDSSGGENWNSSNHVNRNGEIHNSFRGYRVFYDEDITYEGLRSHPSVSISDSVKSISGSVLEFWQNFPKAIETKEKALIIRIFPQQYRDLFELQGGEQKTHTVFVGFGGVQDKNRGLYWLQNPLCIRSRAEWYAKTKVIGSITNGDGYNIKKLYKAVEPAIKGDYTFFKRREITDEYGWRNFGDLYADHEAVGYMGSGPLISHYNNQYDGIYGMLTQFLRDGDRMWFVLANQLCNHVKDIDIYHTDCDRPEYNRGLFWHTDHYKDAQTSTHRCFSQKNADSKNRTAYGGGPSLSHNYTTGLLLHYYLTGSFSSREAVNELTVFVKNNLSCEETFANRVIKNTKRIISFVKDPLQKQPLVQINKVYGLDGPGRASGNSLNTLLDAYVLTGNKKHLDEAEYVIQKCINPDDNIDKRDLLDVENRWMYLVFLQSLGKFLDIKTMQGYFDIKWQYARHCLIKYAEWMVHNEYLYLEKPEKLEYPNETWAVQEIRKCSVLLYAARYVKSRRRDQFVDKAKYFYDGSMKLFDTFETKTLTRPIVLLMLNGMMLQSFKEFEVGNREPSNLSPHLLSERYKHHLSGEVISSVMKNFVTFSLKREFQFLKWRLIAK